MAFKMKGHTLPGINQKMDQSSLSDGRAKSSAFQLNEEKNGMSNDEKMKRAVSQGKMAKWNKANPNATQDEMNAQQRLIWAAERKAKEAATKTPTTTP